jgi:hypothetical protein
MSSWRIGVGFAIGLVFSMTLAPSALAVGLVSYYAGNVTYSSEDGSTSYGGTTSLVKRTVNKGRHEIIEVVLQPPKKIGGLADEFVTHLTQQKKSSTFTAFDEGKTFRGSLTYAGPDWKWTHWTYAIEMTANGEPTGEKLTGDGEITPFKLTTSKLLTDANGKPKFLVREDLDRVSPVEYEKLKSEMTKP